MVHLPLVAPRFVSTWPITLQTAGSFPGAACFSHVQIGLTLRKISRGWPDTRQSGSPPGAGNKHPYRPGNLFEDEDDDENENEKSLTDPTSAIPLSRIGLISLKQTRLEIPGTKTGE